MPSILWGDDEGADVCVPFNGYCSLSGARLLNAGAADDDVVLAWDAASPTGKTLLWRCDEASWNGTPGEVLDASGNGNTGRAISGAQTVNGALDRYGNCSLGSTIRGDTALNWYQQYTLECWLYPDAGIANGRQYINAGFDTLSLRHHNLLAIYRVYGVAKLLTLPRDQWLYLTLQAAPGGAACEVYINGVNVVSSTGGAGSAGTQTLAFGGSNSGLYLQPCRVDEVQVTLGSKLRSGNFTPPVWCKSAAQNGGVQPYVQVSGAGLAGMLPATVSWTAQTGSAYGKVHSVWVNDVTSGWVQVGGAYPTSPVSVSGLVLASNDAVQVALEPEAVSGIQNASPTLYDVMLEYTFTPAGVSFIPRHITPVRLGPRLLPIGVI